MKADGKDGVFTDEINYPNYDAVVFAPNQIKSATDNAGTFNGGYGQVSVSKLN
jgi:hypothetical protein